MRRSSRIAAVSWRRDTQKILGGGITCEYIVLNVLDVKSMPDKVRCAAAKFPENRIDILVNSAGLVAHTDFCQMTEEEYDSIMDVNAKGTYFMSQAVSHFMIEKKTKGHILNVTSSSALRPAWTPYQMSKWAVRGLTLGLADLLLPYGIVVNAIAPGPVATPMLGKAEGDSIENPESPCGRFAMPEEIASLAVFMVSDMGRQMVKGYKDAKLRVRYYENKRRSLLKRASIVLPQCEEQGVVIYDVDEVSNWPDKDKATLKQYITDKQVVLCIEKGIASIKDTQTREVAMKTIIEGKSCESIVAETGISRATTFREKDRAVQWIAYYLVNRK